MMQIPNTHPSPNRLSIAVSWETAACAPINFASVKGTFNHREVLWTTIAGIVQVQGDAGENVLFLFEMQQH